MPLGRLIICIAVAFAGQATAFEVAEFKSGMTRNQVRTLLDSWRFDRVQDSAETLLAYDQPDKGSNRSFRFHFCNDRLAALEQAMKPSVRSFIVITSNYVTVYGQPMKLDAGVNVISSGEKNSMALTWRKGNEVIGVRYLLLPGGEDLFIVYEVPNTCWQVPRP
jgi:hypothetical protein